MGDRVCARVELIVVLRLVDAHAPEDDGWMVAILQDHLLDVLTGDVLPGRISDMLPAGDLGKDQKSQFIAGIAEGL